MKEFRNHIISNVDYRPRLYKKGKQWVVAGVTMLSLMGLGTVVNSNTHASVKDNINTDLSTRMSSNIKNMSNAKPVKQPTTSNITNQANQLHNRIMANNANFNNSHPVNTHKSTQSSTANQSQNKVSNSSQSVASVSSNSSLVNSKVSNSAISNSLKAYQASFANNVNSKGDIGGHISLRATNSSSASNNSNSKAINNKGINKVVNTSNINSVNSNSANNTSADNKSAKNANEIDTNKHNKFGESRGSYKGLDYIYDPVSKTVEFTGGNLDWSNFSNGQFIGYNHAFLGDQTSAPTKLKKAQHIIFDSDIDVSTSQQLSGFIQDDNAAKTIDLGKNFINNDVQGWVGKNENGMFQSDYNLQELDVPQNLIINTYNNTPTLLESDNNLTKFVVYPGHIPAYEPSFVIGYQTDNSAFNGNWYSISDTSKSNPISLASSSNIQPGTYITNKYVKPRVVPRGSDWTNLHEGTANVEINGNTDTITVSNGTLDDANGHQVGENNYTEFISNIKNSNGDLITSDTLPNQNKDWKIQFNNVEAPSNMDFVLSGGKDSSHNNNAFGNQVSDVDLSGLDTSNTSDMEGMLINNDDLRHVNFGNINTSNVTKMDMLIGSDKSLSDADLSNFDMSNVYDLHDLFDKDAKLSSIELPSHSPKVSTNMSELMASDPSLTNISWNGFNTHNAWNMAGFFRADNSLSNITLPSSFDTSNVQNFGEDMFHGYENDGMFQSDMGLKNIDLSHANFNTSNAIAMDEMFGDDKELKNINFGNQFNTSMVKSAKVMFGYSDKISDLDLPAGFDTSNMNMSNMLESDIPDGGLKKIIVNNSDTKLNNSVWSWGNHNLYRVNSDGSTGSTPVDMSDAGKGTYVTTPNLPSTIQYSDIYGATDGGNTIKITKGMIKNASDTKSGWSYVDNNGKPVNNGIKDSKGNVMVAPVYYGMTYKYDKGNHSVEFKNGKMTWNGDNNGFLHNNSFDMTASDLINPTNINSIKFDSDINTNNLTDANDMFDGDSALQSLTLSTGFGKNIIHAFAMISGDSALQSLTLPTGFGKNITNAFFMFDNDPTLQSLTLPTGFGKNIIHAGWLFNSDPALQSLTLPTGFGQNIINARDMFKADSGLQSLTLQNPLIYSNQFKHLLTQFSDIAPFTHLYLPLPQTNSQGQHYTTPPTDFVHGSDKPGTYIFNPVKATDTINIVNNSDGNTISSDTESDFYGQSNNDIYAPRGYHFTDGNHTESFNYNGTTHTFDVDSNIHTIHINFNGDNDNSTNHKDMTGNYTSDSNVKAPHGYHFSDNQPTKPVNFSHNNQIFNFNVVPDKVTIPISYNDGSNTVKSSDTTGNYGSTIDYSKIINNIPFGYHLASNTNNPSTYNYNQNITIQIAKDAIKGQVKFVNHQNGQEVGTPVSDNGHTGDTFNPSNYKNQVPTNYQYDEADNNDVQPLNNDGTYTVYVNPITNTMTVNYKNGNNIISNTSISGNQGTNVPASTINNLKNNIPTGYHFNNISGDNSFTPNGTLNINVDPDTITIPVSYKDGNNTVKSSNTTGSYGTAINYDSLNNQVPNGYKLVSDASTNPTNYDFNKNIVINVAPKTVKITNTVKYVNTTNDKTVSSTTVSGNSGSKVDYSNAISNIPHGYQKVALGQHDDTFKNNSDVDVIFVKPVQVSATVLYKDNSNGKVVNTSNVKGNYGSDIDYNSLDNNIPKGYTFNSNASNNPTTYDNGDVITINVDKEIPKEINGNITVNYNIDGRTVKSINAGNTQISTSNSTYNVPASILSQYIKDGYSMPNTQFNITKQDINNGYKNITLNFNATSAGTMTIHYYAVDLGRDVGTVSYSKDEIMSLCPYASRTGFQWLSGENIELAPYADRQADNAIDNITGNTILYILGSPDKPIPRGTHLSHTVNDITLQSESGTPNLSATVGNQKGLKLCSYVTFSK